MTAGRGPVLAVLGAGTAGLEALLSARQRLPGAQLCLIAPELTFRYRPIDARAPLAPSAERALPIADLVAETGAAWVRDRAAAVHPTEREVVTRDGDTVGYDFLVVAAGARSRAAVPDGCVWERGHDPAYLDLTIEGILRGRIHHAAIVVPHGARWSIPAYELTLVLAWKAAGTRARISLITAEPAPGAALGQAAADLIAAELADAGVQLRCSDTLRDSDRPDRVISLPAMIGPSLAGLPTDANGFVDVDHALRVPGGGRVWAVGGCAAAALAHSALGARQADAAIAQIAAAVSGDDRDGPPAMPDVSGLLMTGQRERWLADNPGSRGVSTRCLWWPPGRAVGHMLAGRIAAWDPSSLDRLPERPQGLVISAPVALGAPHQPVESGEASEAVRTARARDVENRQLMAVRRREREANAELRELRDRLETFTLEEHEIVRDLEHHGYLTGTHV